MGVKHIEACTNSDIYKLKHLKTGKNGIVFGNQNKSVCKVRQVMSRCLTFSHTFICPIGLVHEESWCSMVSYDWADGVVHPAGIFFRHGIISRLWVELVLF